jgi:(p)ppGpp synthase/HD superfamily hydrolase
MERDVVSEAVMFATHAHLGQPKKGTRAPYIWHPLSVGKLLHDVDAPLELVVAGILHDTVEDTAVTLEEIENRFGHRVAELVKGCSESDKSSSWEERKMHTIKSLRAAPDEVKIVSAADKLDNLRTINTDLRKVGDRVWKRFRRGRDKQETYYRSVLASLKSGGDEISIHPLVCALEAEIESVFGTALSEKDTGRAALGAACRTEEDSDG